MSGEPAKLPLDNQFWNWKLGLNKHQLSLFYLHHSPFTDPCLSKHPVTAGLTIFYRKGYYTDYREQLMTERQELSERDVKHTLIIHGISRSERETTVYKKLLNLIIQKTTGEFRSILLLL
eukprot:TRINITY_DN6159_c0_g1_i3.p1 TRINITY_DN6159_c0_g1~~TRINITY_DN6159_c0_g1_i3.p1  ORF type:complete len:120 (+),score=14.52 TRINITY_DN6159_c0_g1_i3:132-491(+)